jgi:light-regulated signal transduction histidine kinase (bacteriophytochrome)
MVTSFVQLLARRYQGRLDADADRFIGHAVDGVTRMQTLINDLLAFSRVGKKEPAFKRVSAETLLESAQEDLAQAITAAGATVTHGPLPEVYVDEGLIRQVLMNLVGNAIKFHGGDAPRVEVSAVSHGDEVELRVRDNGLGIEPAYFERIFVIFQRLQGRANHPGNGIGLSICKKIVERHGGRIWVESEPGHGATFHFTVPAPPRGEARS